MSTEALTKEQEAEALKASLLDLHKKVLKARSPRDRGHMLILSGPDLVQLQDALLDAAIFIENAALATKENSNGP